MMKRRFYFLLLVSIMLLPIGCQLPVTILSKLFPKEKVPPIFTLPAKKTILVFPDDIKCPLLYPTIKRALAEKADKLLIEHSLASEITPYDKLIDLRNVEPKFNEMSIPKIGRCLGADLVIYVSIEDFSLKDNSVNTLWRGRFSARVKVVDVLKGRIWPDESAGFSISINEPITENPSEAFGAELARKLAERMAEEVCGLFRERHLDRARPKEKETDLQTFDQ
ncbi:MAG: hypothetical protein K8R91_01705 [Phycisphaerae bacterium]|nr:hypothetical protein [Phycisphaerae bacterium]